MPALCFFSVRSDLLHTAQQILWVVKIFVGRGFSHNIEPAEKRASAPEAITQPEITSAAKAGFQPSLTAGLKPGPPFSRLIFRLPFFRLRFSRFPGLVILSGAKNLSVLLPKNQERFFAPLRMTNGAPRDSETRAGRQDRYSIFPTCDFHNSHGRPTVASVMACAFSASPGVRYLMKGKRIASI
jgi:hypothetical protein